MRGEKRGTELKYEIFFYFLFNPYKIKMLKSLQCNFLLPTWKHVEHGQRWEPVSTFNESIKSILKKKKKLRSWGGSYAKMIVAETGTNWHDGFKKQRWGS